MIKKYIIVSSFFIATFLFAQDFDQTKIYINPGHGGHDSNDRYIEATGFWESEGNLTKGLYLRDILLNLNADVYMSRTLNRTEDDLPLSQIDADANANNVDIFHSIHSNAYNASSNYTLLLYKETNGSPVDPLSQQMGSILTETIYKANRTTAKYNRGDYSFLGFHLGVLNYLNYDIMRGTLSEGSFHDYVPESWRLQNLDYRKHEAIAILRGFIEYFSLDPLPHGVIAGLVRNPDEYASWNYNSAQQNDKYTPINNVTVTLIESGKTYQTDNYNNGFYMFDSLAPGTYHIAAQADGYPADTSEVNVSANTTSFNDVFLVSTVPPYVVSTYPVEGDTSFSILEDIVVNFSRAMNTTSVESTLVIQPEIPVRFLWSNDDRKMTIKSDSLHFLTNYKITISGEATSRYGYLFDGNADSTGGDSVSFSFRTGYDNLAPEITSYYPAINQTGMEIKPVVSFVYDEIIDSSSITEDIFKLERYADRSATSGILEHYIVKGRSVLNFFPEFKLYPNEVYVSRIAPGISDRFGNEEIDYRSYSFKTGTVDFEITNIDAFEGSFTDNWWQPSGSGSTTGIDAATNRSAELEITNTLTSSLSALEIYYDWDLSKDNWLIREYLSGGQARNVQFDSDYIMQCYIFGDGSNTKFRFAVDEGDGTNWPNHEVSDWIDINWYGWKLVEWDMNDTSQVGLWDNLGNGKLDMSKYRFDSIQLSYQESASETGTLFFDDLRLVKKVTATSIEKITEVATDFQLFQNYPNPFNPETTIEYNLPLTSFVKLEVFNNLGQKISTLLNQKQNAGIHKIKFNGTTLPSGVYYYRLTAGGFQQVNKMFLIK